MIRIPIIVYNHNQNPYRQTFIIHLNARLSENDHHQIPRHKQHHSKKYHPGQRKRKRHQIQI